MTSPRRPTKSRFVVETPSPRSRISPARGLDGPRKPELWIAISVIIAAALATFVALFMTSRPFDPMSASLEAQQVVPAGPSLTPSPKSSVTPTPSPINEGTPSAPGGETATATPDDATIQSRIESALASDPVLAGLAVTTMVENGKVTIVGSVKSSEVKQRVERTIRAVKGVGEVDNQLVITDATP